MLVQAALVRRVANVKSTLGLVLQERQPRQGEGMGKDIGCVCQGAEGHHFLKSSGMQPSVFFVVLLSSFISADKCAIFP